MAETNVGSQTFLQKMSLRTGAEIINFLQVINKAADSTHPFTILVRT